MERKCKNCSSLVYASKAYCADCGAKWIEKRITMRNVGVDFADMYLGIDTKFGRNFLDLFRHPDRVINGYIEGARMNYVDAIRYVFIAIFMSGMYMFFLKTFEIDLTAGFTNNDEMYRSMGYTDTAIQQMNNRNEGVFDFISKYQSLVVFLTLPLFALVGRISFWKNKKYNFTEHLVFHMYTYSHFIIITTPISIVLSVVSLELLFYWSLIAYPMLFIYNTYCYQKCLNLNWQDAIVKAFVALLVLFILGIVITFLLLLSGFLGALIYLKFIDPSWDPSEFFGKPPAG